MNLPLAESIGKYNISYIIPVKKILLFMISLTAHNNNLQRESELIYSVAHITKLEIQHKDGLKPVGMMKNNK